MSALEERRQCAREAGQDRFDPDLDGGAIFESCLDEAIEVATRVKITPDIVRAYHEAWAASGCSREAGLKAALLALGFEVEP